MNSVKEKISQLSACLEDIFSFLSKKDSSNKTESFKRYFFFPLLESGRKAIKSNNGLQLLYRFCTNCPEEKAYDCLLSRICGIINQCLEKKELPVPEMSPAR